MYAQHFGLTAEPFSLTPDPEFLYLSTGHAEALAALKIGLLGKRGLMVMTGEVGTGKTTLLYALLRALGDGTRTAYVSNTALGFDGLLRLALLDFGVTPATSARLDMLTALNQLLRDCAERDVTATLIVDEAQNLDADAFEQLRLLTNFETFTHKLLQVVLVGQPELAERLRDPALRALVERVAVHCQLEPLGERESRAYIDYRLLRVGGSPRLFERDARDRLLAAAEGLPRRINILCHNALLFAYGRGASRVTLQTAELAVAGRAALLYERPLQQAAPLHAAPRNAAPQPVQSAQWRGIPRLAVALGAALLVAVLGVAGLRLASRSTEAAGADPSPAKVLDLESSNSAPVHAQALPVTVAGAAQIAAMPPAVDSAPAVPAAGPAAGERVASAAPPAAERAPSRPAVTAADPVEPPPAVPAPVVDVPPADAGFRSLRVANGATLESLAREVYGAVDPALIKRIQSANPQVVNPNRIMAGDTLHFPASETEQPLPQESDPQ